MEAALAAAAAITLLLLHLLAAESYLGLLGVCPLVSSCCLGDGRLDPALRLYRMRAE